jgi:hypothetical protein
MMDHRFNRFARRGREGVAATGGIGVAGGATRRRWNNGIIVAHNQKIVNR